MECAYAYAGTYEGEKQLPAGKLKRNKGRSETQMDKRADSCMKCKNMVTYIICLRTETVSDVRLRMEIRYFTRRRMKNGTFPKKIINFIPTDITLKVISKKSLYGIQM